VCASKIEVHERIFYSRRSLIARALWLKANKMVSRIVAGFISPPRWGALQEVVGDEVEPLEYGQTHGVALDTPGMTGYATRR